MSSTTRPVSLRTAPPRALALADTGGGARALAWSADAALIAQIEAEDFCGSHVRLNSGTFAPL